MKFLGYCFLEKEGVHLPGTNLESLDDVINYVLVHKEIYPEIRITNAADEIVVHVVDYKVVFPFEWNQLAELHAKPIDEIYMYYAGGPKIIVLKTVVDFLREKGVLVGFDLFTGTVLKNTKKEIRLFSPNKNNVDVILAEFNDNGLKTYWNNRGWLVFEI